MSIKKWSFDLLDRAVPAKHAGEGFRALCGESPIHPESVQKGLESKFGGALKDAFNARLELAKFLPPFRLRGKAYTLYEKFMLEIPSEKKMGASASWAWISSAPEATPPRSLSRSPTGSIRRSSKGCVEFILFHRNKGFEGETRRRTSLS